MTLMTNSFPPELCFPSIFEIYNQRWGPIVYRHIDAALKEILSMILSYLKSKFWQHMTNCTRYIYRGLRVKSAATMYNFYLGILMFLSVPDILEFGIFRIPSGTSPKCDLLFLVLFVFRKFNRNQFIIFWVIFLIQLLCIS